MTVNDMIPVQDGAVLPVFPLPNFVMFPGVVTRLHVFEPRYRQLVTDILDRHGLFCITTLVGDWQSTYHTKVPRFNDVGCVCLVRDYDHLDDGNYNVIVQAIARTTLEEVDGEEPYRTARASIAEIEVDPEIEDKSLGALRLLAESVLSEQEDVDDEQVQKITDMAPVPLITTLSYYCAAPVETKLELLELPSYAEMAPVLVDLYTQQLTEGDAG